MGPFSQAQEKVKLIIEADYLQGFVPCRECAVGFLRMFAGRRLSSDTNQKAITRLVKKWFFRPYHWRWDSRSPLHKDLTFEQAMKAEEKFWEEYDRFGQGTRRRRR